MQSDCCNTACKTERKEGAKSRRKTGERAVFSTEKRKRVAPVDWRGKAQKSGDRIQRDEGNKGGRRESSGYGGERELGLVIQYNACQEKKKVGEE
jgi:hypothetical protein